MALEALFLSTAYYSGYQHGAIEALFLSNAYYSGYQHGIAIHSTNSIHASGLETGP